MIAVFRPNSVVTMLLSPLLIWLLFGCGVPAHADNAPISPPSRFVLPNGVRLILKPETEGNRVAVSLFVGIASERAPANSALGEMVARTLFYGNANRTQDSIQALIGEVGGSLDVLRTEDMVAINYVTISSQLPEALHLLCDCLKYTSFAPESLQVALQTIHAERQAACETSFTRGYDAVNELLGLGEPTEEALRRVTQAQAQAYFQRHYVPAHTVISVVGHFETARIQGLLNAFLADYTRPANTHFAAKNAHPNSAQIFSMSLPASGNSAYAFVGASAPAVSSADYPAFAILQAILGSGHASRLFRQARETLGLGYEVGALYPAERSPTFITYLQWHTERNELIDKTPVKPNAVTKLLNGELDGILEHPPTAEELKRAQQVAIGQDALRHERARDRAFLLGWYEIAGRGYLYDALFPRQLAEVTREDVLRVAKTYLNIRANVTVLPAPR